MFAARIYLEFISKSTRALLAALAVDLRQVISRKGVVGDRKLLGNVARRKEMLDSDR